MDYRPIEINDKTLKEQESVWQNLLDTLPNADRDHVVQMVESTRAAIASDGKRAEHPVKRLFEIIETAIVYPILGVGKALRYCKIKGNDYGLHFFRIARKIPSDYINHHRIDLARELLRMTDLSMYKIALIVGYSNQSIFYKNYKKVVGYKPSDEAKSKNEIVIADPRIPSTTAEVVINDSPDDLGSFWEQIKDMSREDINTFIVNRYRLIDIRHFRLLLERSRYEGRRDKARGEELAHSALDTLHLIKSRTGKYYFEELALAYAYIANACRMQYKYDESSDYFETAYLFLRERRPTLLSSRIDLLKVSLFWWCRDTEAALDLLCEILPVFRLHGSKNHLSRALQLGGEICLFSGNSDRALQYLREAAELTEFVDDTVVKFSAHYNLTMLYARLDRGKDAAAQFQHVQKLRAGIQVSDYDLFYLEGAVCRINRELEKAQRLLEDAVKGHHADGFELQAALASLELSVVYLDSKKLEPAIAAVAKALPWISRYSSHQKGIAALTILQEAISRNDVNRSIVTMALNQLEYIWKDPLFDDRLKRQGAAPQ